MSITNGTWEGSLEKLAFWDHLSTGSYPDLESGGIIGIALILPLLQERRP
jgi:hypothetical protein